MVYILIKFPQ